MLRHWDSNAVTLATVICCQWLIDACSIDALTQYSVDAMVSWSWHEKRRGGHHVIYNNRDHQTIKATTSCYTVARVLHGTICQLHVIFQCDTVYHVCKDIMSLSDHCLPQDAYCWHNYPREHWMLTKHGWPLLHPIRFTVISTVIFHSWVGRSYVVGLEAVALPRFPLRMPNDAISLKWQLHCRTELDN